MDSLHVVLCHSNLCFNSFVALDELDALIELRKKSRTSSKFGMPFNRRGECYVQEG